MRQLFKIHAITAWGYVLEWDWLSMFNILTTNTTWHNNLSLNICVFNGVHYASEPSYHIDIHHIS